MTSFQTGNAAFTILPIRTAARRSPERHPRAQRDTLTIHRTVRQRQRLAANRPSPSGMSGPVIVTQPFAVIAHRAGGRNSDMLPASENTVAMALMAERFGATGIEIDVRLTSDDVPIIFHDENLNLRLNVKNGLVGPVESYSYLQLQTFVRFIHGETIPDAPRDAGGRHRQDQPALSSGWI